MARSKSKGTRKRVFKLIMKCVRMAPLELQQELSNEYAEWASVSGLGCGGRIDPTMQAFFLALETTLMQSMPSNVREQYK